MSEEIEISTISEDRSNDLIFGLLMDAPGLSFQLRAHELLDDHLYSNLSSEVRSTIREMNIGFLLTLFEGMIEPLFNKFKQMFKEAFGLGYAELGYIPKQHPSSSGAIELPYDESSWDPFITAFEQYFKSTLRFAMYTQLCMDYVTRRSDLWVYLNRITSPENNLTRDGSSFVSGVDAGFEDWEYSPSLYGLVNNAAGYEYYMDGHSILSVCAAMLVDAGDEEIPSLIKQWTLDTIHDLNVRATTELDSTILKERTGFPKHQQRLRCCVWLNNTAPVVPTQLALAAASTIAGRCVDPELVGPAVTADWLTQWIYHHGRYYHEIHRVVTEINTVMHRENIKFEKHSLLVACMAAYGNVARAWSYFLGHSPDQEEE